MPFSAWDTHEYETPSLNCKLHENHLTPSRREVLVDGDRLERLGTRDELGAVEPVLDGPRRVATAEEWMQML